MHWTIVTTKLLSKQDGIYVQNQFNSLKLFCGGIATPFPGTLNVESNFSIVKWEKDGMQMNLSDFSLEGILHAKQCNKTYHLENLPFQLLYA